MQKDLSKRGYYKWLKRLFSLSLKQIEGENRILECDEKLKEIFEYRRIHIR